jgi:hemerythrin superfamily protein
MATPKTKQRQASARTRRTTSARTTPGASKSKFPGVLSMLKEEHDLVKELFDRFEKETEQDPAAGEKTAMEICTELTRHAEMEEKIVYPKLKAQDEDIYFEAQEEHHVAKVLISEIESMRPDGVWRAKVTVLAENVRHHIDEEESEAFPEMKELGVPELEEMGKAWEQMKAAWKPSKAKTRAA